MMLNRVPILREDDGSLPSEARLLEEMCANPVCRGLTIIHPPKWFRSEYDFGKVHGSVIFSFVDTDGSRAHAMIRQPPSMFGERVRPRKYETRPALRQCQRCWRLGHESHKCPRPTTMIVCPRCAGAHHLPAHHTECPHRAVHSIAGQCDCPITCFNCRQARLPGKGHTVTDIHCPLKKKFRTITENEEEDQPHPLPRNRREPIPLPASAPMITDETEEEDPTATNPVDPVPSSQPVDDGDNRSPMPTDWETFDFSSLSHDAISNLPPEAVMAAFRRLVSHA